MTTSKPASGQESRGSSDSPFARSVKYVRRVPTLDVDVYRVLKAFNVTDPAIQHAVKKLLCAGIRGQKGFAQDLAEAADALARCAEMLEEETADPRLCHGVSGRVT